MTGDKWDLIKIDTTDRKNLLFLIMKGISYAGSALLSKVITEIPDSVTEIKKNDEKAVYLYTGMHKSLWETTGILVTLNKQGLAIPSVGMGDNLIKGQFFLSLVKNLGIFLIKRGSTRGDMIQSARMLKQYIISYMAEGYDALIFPEGTRKNIPSKGQYGNFFPTAFDAVLEYEKNKNAISTANNLSQHNSYIIPFNVDYSRVREAFEMLREKNVPRTLKVWDSLKMLKHLKTIYVSYGEPIPVRDHLDMNRKELSLLARERCLELVKILPINIVAKAVIEAFKDQSIDKHEGIHYHIEKTIEKLQPYKKNFREFSSNEGPESIYKKVTSYEKLFESPKQKYLQYYKLYSNYISHYFT